MSLGLQINTSKSNRSWYWLMAVVVVTIVGVSGWYVYRFYTTGATPPLELPMPVANAKPDAIEQPITAADKTAYTVAPEKPRYFSINKLGIENARILPVGITQDGALDTPRNIYDVGWYSKSATPGGDITAMLLDGHNGGPTKGGVFQDLDKLKQGDTITIENGAGKQYTYVVQSNQSYTLTQMDTTVMPEMAKSVQPGTQGLNIISCVGTWIPQQKTYDHRQVVRAILKITN